MKPLNATTLKITISCFIAPSCFIAFLILFEVCLYRSIHFNNYIVSKFGLLGCVLQPWKTYNLLIFWVYELFWMGLSYRISRKGYLQKNTNLKILGAFLLFSAIFIAYRWWHGNPLSFLDYKEGLTKQAMPIFSNHYYLKWAVFIKMLVFLLLLIIISYRTVFKFWDKKLRIKYLTIGFITTIVGYIFWVKILGRIFVYVMSSS